MRAGFLASNLFDPSTQWIRTRRPLFTRYFEIFLGIHIQVNPIPPPSIDPYWKMISKQLFIAGKNRLWTPSENVNLICHQRRADSFVSECGMRRQSLVVVPETGEVTFLLLYPWTFLHPLNLDGERKHWQLLELLQISDLIHLKWICFGSFILFWGVRKECSLWR